MRTQRCDVLVVGGGPVGLLLGVLLARAGVDVAVWEGRTEASTTSRAIGVHAPALHVLDEAQVAEPVLAASVLVRRGLARSRGRLLGGVSFAGVDPRFPFVAAVPQWVSEALLAEQLETLAPGALARGTRLTGLTVTGPGAGSGAGADAGSVAAGGGSRTGGHAAHLTGTAGTAGTTGTAPTARTARTAATVGEAWVHVRGEGPDGASGPVELQARVVVGADGSRSTVRDLVGIGAPVLTYPDTFVMGDLADSTQAGDDAVIHLEPAGVVESFPLPGGRRRLVVRTRALVARPRAADLTEVVAHRTGIALDPGSCSMISAFAVRRRLAERMVAGPVVLLGDAAHEISPIGGQGMNLGWLDAAALTPLLVRALAPGADPRTTRADLADFEKRRSASARRAARQAALNMSLGRPVRGLRLDARDLALRAVLGSPAAGTLASVYAMRWT